MSKAFFVTERRKIRNGEVLAGAENFGQRGRGIWQQGVWLAREGAVVCAGYISQRGELVT